jgi:hypothetical protein
MRGKGAWVWQPRQGSHPRLSAGGQLCLRSGSCDCHGLFRQGKLDTGVNIVTCSRLEYAYPWAWG